MTPIEKVEQAFREVYLLKDTGIVRLTCATVLANRLNLDPVWLFIVGSPGSGKTEFVNSLLDVAGIIPLSSLTSHTFISGQKKTAGGQETSLLEETHSGIIAFKDFTSFLSLRYEEKVEIIAQLREIYDGSLTKRFGNGKKVRWVGKIGIIAGVTEIIYLAREQYSAMGERFIMYSPLLADHKDIARKAMENAPVIHEKRLLLREIMKNYLDNEITIPTKLPKLTNEFREEIISLANMSARARSKVEREPHSSSHEIIFVQPPEVPTRISAQMQILALAFMIMRNVPDLPHEDKQIIYKIALDSMTSTRRICLQKLTQYNSTSTAALASSINYPTNTVHRWLEDLNALELVNRIKSTGADRWTLKHEYRILMEKYENISMTDDELPESMPEDVVSDEMVDEAINAKLAQI